MRAGDAAAALMCECLPALGEVRTPLVVGEGLGLVAAAVRAAGGEPGVWLRSVAPLSGVAATAWVPDGQFDASLIRLPKAKDALVMALHAAAAKLHTGAPVALFGANGEGIRSAGRLLAAVADQVETVATRHHARVLIGQRKPAIAGLKISLSDWRQSQEIEISGARRSWVSYPGTFAKGGLDQGTAFLLEHLPNLTPGAQVLDFAAGTGVIATEVATRCPSARIDMIDSDALAVEAARENVPTATALIGESLMAGRGAPYDLIVSNPPIHDGIVESRRVLDQLIADAPHHLKLGGRLVIVVQRRIKVMAELRRAFGDAVLIAEDGRFNVAMAEKPARLR